MSADVKTRRSHKKYRKGYHRFKKSRKPWMYLVMVALLTQHSVAAGLHGPKFNNHQRSPPDPNTPAHPSPDFNDSPSPTDPISSLRYYRAPSVFSDSTSRVRRASADDKLSKSLANLQSLSRIASGVLLEIGLINGTIPPNDAIAELLHIGALSPEDIIGLDPAAVDSVVKLLESLISKPTNEVLAIEKRLVELEDMREVAPRFANLSEKVTDGRVAYVEALNKLKALDVLDTELGDMKSLLGSLKSALDSLNRFKSKTLDDKIIAASILQLNLMVHQMGDLQTSITQFLNSSAVKLKDAKQIQETSEFINLISIDYRFQNISRVRVNFNAPEFDTVASNVKSVLDGAGTAANSRIVLEPIQKLVDSRQPIFRQAFQYTSGLPSGQLDLLKLNGDSGNSWITGRIANSSFVSRGLEVAFKHFDELSSKLKSIGEAWNRLDTSSSRAAIYKMFEFNNQLAKVAGDSKVASGLIAELKNCTEESVVPLQDSDFEKITETINSVNLFNEKIGKISDFDYLNRFTSLDVISKNFNTTGMSADEVKTLLQSTLGKLGTDDELVKFEKDVDQLDNDLTEFLKFNTEAKSFNIDFTPLNVYVKTMAQLNFVGLYSCLAAIETKDFPVKVTLDTIHNLRRFSISPETKATVHSIVASGDILKQAKEKADEFKNATDRESVSLALSTPEGYADSAHKLGMAVQGLAAISKIYKAKAELDPLLAKIQEILTDAEKKGLSKDQKEALQKLDLLPGVFQEISSFLTTSKGLQEFTRRKRDTGFDGLQTIFEDAAGLKGAEINMKSLREAMKKLVEAVPKKYNDVYEKVNLLETLDLDLAKFHIGDAIGSLSSFDEFSVTYASIMAKPIPVPIPPQASQSKVGDDGSKSKSGEPEFATEGRSRSFIDDYYWVGIVAFLLVAAIIAITILLLFRNKEPKVIYDDIVIPPVAPFKADPPPPPIAEKPVVPPPPPPVEPPPVVPPPVVEPLPPPPPAENPGPAPGRRDEDSQLDPTQSDHSQHEGDANRVPQPRLENVPPPPPPEIPLEDQLSWFRAAVQNLKLKSTKLKSPLVVHNLFLTAIGNLVSTNDDDIYLGTSEAARAIRYSPPSSTETDRKYYCVKSSMSRITGFADNFINANVIRIGQNDWHMAQGPLHGDEDHDIGIYHKGKKVDTREKHWALIDQNNIGVVCQLAPPIESRTEKRRDPNFKEVFVTFDVDQCAVFYSENVGGVQTCGKYTIKTIRVQNQLEQFTVNRDDLFLFTLEYTNSETNATKTVDVLLMKSWKNRTVPEKPETALEIIKFLDDYHRNVVVQGSSGAGRAETLVTIKYGLDLGRRQKITGLSDVVLPIRNARFHAIDYYKEVSYLLICLAKDLMTRNENNAFNVYCHLEYYHKKIVAGAYEILEPRDAENNFKKVPVPPKEIQRVLNIDALACENYVLEKTAEYRQRKNVEKKASNSKKSASSASRGTSSAAMKTAREGSSNKKEKSKSRKTVHDKNKKQENKKKKDGTNKQGEKKSSSNATN